ncbi:MAG: carboxypeptidase regulatory-like domain-containing protein, partial [Pyrinomonadaceae bacterium]|nr:carboxypeptidase regulatory-like domain-containing protein [Pyrinomonadaceae bacterium]
MKILFRPQTVIGLLLFILIPHSVIGQITEAALKGTVLDAAGNVLAASPIVARNDDTGQTRNATTDNNGQFLLAGLPSGSYT